MDSYRILFNQASETEKSRGISWYREAREYLQAMGLHYNIPFKVIAGTCAALSPRVSWEVNLINLNLLCRFVTGKDKRKPKGLTPNIKKGETILKEKLVTPTLSGEKVIPFFFNLLGNENEITLDTLMINAYHNSLSKNTLKKHDRVNAENSIRQLAKENGLTCAQVQAIIWVTWHRVVKSKSPGYITLLKIF